MKSEKDKDTIRITDQFRGKRGMVYDLRCHGLRLSLCIAPRQNQDDLGDWCVEASLRPTGTDSVVTEWGPTKAAALSAVGEFWATHAAALGLPAFNWNDVMKALGAVRAL